MLTFLCPHCGAGTQNNLLWHNPQAYQEPFVLKVEGQREYRTNAVFQQFVYQCVVCTKATYFLRKNVPPIKQASSGPGNGMGIPSYVFRGHVAVVHQHPVPTVHVHPAVPEAVAGATDEAEKCYSIGAYNACAVMLRRAVDSLCQDRKAEGNDLYNRLKYLKDNQLITPDLWEWCEELRILGKSGAHPEWQDATREEAEYALRFLREILRYIYVNPHERGQRRLKENKALKDE